MKKGFTLIELIVVIIILVLLMSVIIPKGSKMLESFEKSLLRTEQNQQLSKNRSNAFIKAENRELAIANKKYYISSKGIISE